MKHKLPFSTKQKKLNFVSIWRAFCLQNLTTTILTKYVLPDFQPLCCCNFMQKIRKVSCMNFSQNLKNLTLGSFWTPFGEKSSKQIFSQKKPSCSILKTLWCCSMLFRSILSWYAITLSKKIRKFWVSTFLKIWKTSFLAHFNPFRPENLETRFFPQKNHLHQL